MSVLVVGVVAVLRDWKVVRMTGYGDVEKLADYILDPFITRDLGNNSSLGDCKYNINV